MSYPPTKVTSYQLFTRDLAKEEMPIYLAAYDIQARMDAINGLVLAGAAQGRADAAYQAATDAQTDATVSLQLLEEIASDTLFTPSEKPALIREKAELDAEYPIIYASGTTFGNLAQRDAYAAAKLALDNYFATLTSPADWNSMAGNTTVDPVVFKQKYVDYYTARQDLLIDNADVARSTAVQAGVDATNAATAAGDAYDAAVLAQGAADDAQADATASLQQLTDIAADTVLTPSEKIDLIREKQQIDAEFVGIESAGTTFGNTTERTAYVNAKNALDTYLTGLGPVAWNSMAGNTTVPLAATFRQYFVNYYTARQVLLDKNADTARANAAAAAAAASDAQADATSALTLAGSKAAVFYQNTAPTNPINGYTLKTDDLWFDTSLWAAADVTAGLCATADIGKTKYLTSRWSGAAWASVERTKLIVAGEIAAGAVTASKVQADDAFFNAVATGRLKTSNYAEDGSGNPTAGAKLDSEGTSLKVAPGSLRTGARAILTSVDAAAPTLADGKNVTSITGLSGNRYRLNFTNAFPGTDYVVVGKVERVISGVPDEYPNAYEIVACGFKTDSCIVALRSHEAGGHAAPAWTAVGDSGITVRFTIAIIQVW